MYLRMDMECQECKRKYYLSVKIPSPACCTIQCIHCKSYNRQKILNLEYPAKTRSEIE